ncbi:hypothetical protein AVEN_237936-1 [Araneus ventricosus]|uniref:Deoxyuridine 5'-triphosphate nucleotidohydrolase n=1 Tax=Araneus ventricosus TaxID=182803 RepID=A0A4Y2VCA4_ARAVE|nr:hypothetical protein AVEN_237936-1 [Araneus ventricosus]
MYYGFAPFPYPPFWGWPNYYWRPRYYRPRPPAMWHQTWNRHQNRNQEMSPAPLQVDYELTQPFAVAPTVFDGESPGIDFYYPKNGIGLVIEDGRQVIINTHVVVRLPKGMVGVLMDKSSVVTRKGLKVEAGLIDTGYRGEISVVLRNLSGAQKTIKPGEPIAQMLLHVAHHPTLRKVDKIAADTNRGTRGFGTEQSVNRNNADELKKCEIL